MIIEKDGLQCDCGQCGCWEKYASVSALIEQIKVAVEKHPNGILAECAKDGIDGKTIFTAMEKGSKTAKEVFDKYIDYLAVGIESIINIFDPERILIAGEYHNKTIHCLNPT